MNRRSSSKTNTRSRATDEDGIRLSFSEANTQSEMTEEGDIEEWIGCRNDYGRGMVRIFAWFDEKKQRFILEERDRERSTFTILTTANEVQRLMRFLIMAQKHLPLEQSA